LRPRGQSIRLLDRDISRFSAQQQLLRKAPSLLTAI
jgi:hypothetical protein